SGNGCVSDCISVTVTVESSAFASLSVTLDGVDASAGPITRCITFIARTSQQTCSDPILAAVTFSGNPASGTAGIGLPCDTTWTSVCAKDEQHTLFDSQALHFAGGSYSTVSSLVLPGGDTDNDSDVDINDVTFFIVRYGRAAQSGGCP